MAVFAQGIGLACGQDAAKYFTNVTEQHSLEVSLRRLMPERKVVDETFESDESTVFLGVKTFRDAISPGLLEESTRAVLPPGTHVYVPAEACLVPSDSNAWFSVGLRLYCFGENERQSGLFGWRFKSGDRHAEVVMSDAGSGKFLTIVLRDGNKDIACLPIPVESLPSDIRFSANINGEVDVTASSLSQSKTLHLAAQTEFFRGSATPFEGVFAVGKAPVVVDNYSVCTARDLARAGNVPFLIDQQEDFDPVKEGWKLSFSDEFNGPALNWDNWYVPSWQGPERRKYAFVQDGNLHIRCDWNKDHTSLDTCALHTRKSFAFGYFEARVRFTKNSGWWAAFWLYGLSNSNPMYDGCEVDIFEDYYTRSDKPEGPHRGLLDHNLHVYLGTTLKSWNYQSWIPGSLDEFHTIGCKYTPFEISYYMDGKLMKIAERSNHSSYQTVTFDAFTHCFPTRPLEAIFSGNVMRPTNLWGKKDTTGFVFPEDFLVDWVRIYEYPNDAEDRPAVVWKDRSGTKSNVKIGDTLTFEADVAPAKNGATPINAVYLFDNGYMLECCTKAPWKFEIPYTREYYERSRYMRTGRQRVVPPFSGYPHAFEIYAQDAKGKVSGSGVVFKYPDFGLSSPRGGRATSVPGILKLAEFDDGGANVGYYESSPAMHVRKDGYVDGYTGGEWLKYTVDVTQTGDYIALMDAEVRSIRLEAEIRVYVDDEYVGSFLPEPSDLMTDTWRQCKIPLRLKLEKGRHVLRLVRWSLAKMKSIEFVKVR